MEEGNLIRPDLQETKENDMMKVLGTEIKGKFYGYIQNQKNDRMGHGSVHDSRDDKCSGRLRSGK